MFTRYSRSYRRKDERKKYVSDDTHEGKKMFIVLLSLSIFSFGKYEVYESMKYLLLNIISLGFKYNL